LGGFRRLSLIDKSSRGSRVTGHARGSVTAVGATVSWACIPRLPWRSLVSLVPATEVACPSLTVRVARLSGTLQLSSTPSLPGCGGGALELKTGSAVWALRSGSPPRRACGPCLRAPKSAPAPCNVPSWRLSRLDQPTEVCQPFARVPTRSGVARPRSPRRGLRPGSLGSRDAPEGAPRFVSRLTFSRYRPRVVASFAHRGRLGLPARDQGLVPVRFAVA
jgi:hypothetical protein